MSRQQLIYPLNIYADLLDLAFGSVDHLGYGYQTSAGQPVPQAQQAVCDLLQARLVQPSGARILDAGCGTGILAQQLASAGYEVCAIDSNQAAVAAARERFQTASEAVRPRLELAALENFHCDTAFDCLILQNTSRYIVPLNLFACARRLLKPGGQLLLVEEFVADDTLLSTQPDPLPVLHHILDLARRTGFELSFRQDLSEGVTAWLNQCLELFERFLPELCQRTGYEQVELMALHASMRADRDKCQQGLCCHTILDFRAGASDVTLLPAESMPASSCQELFERSFDTPFDETLWRWKYDDGRGHSVLALKGGQVVAHYGGITRNIYYFSEQRRAIQICDVMVMPEHRSFYSKRSLFFLTAASMLEQHAGNSAQHLLGFGFPNIKAMHVAQRLGLYQKTDELLALSYDVNAGTHRAPGWDVSQVSPGEALQETCNGLWHKMLGAFADGIIGVRDWHYLGYRYEQRPGLDYRFLQLTCAGVAKAIAVTRDHGGHSLVMDLIAAPEDLADALRVLCAFGHGEGRPMVFWLTAGQLSRVEPPQLADTPQLHKEPTGIHIPCNAWTHGPSATMLHQKWWLTAGDMDFL